MLKAREIQSRNIDSYLARFAAREIDRDTKADRMRETGIDLLSGFCFRNQVDITYQATVWKLSPSLIFWFRRFRLLRHYLCERCNQDLESRQWLRCRKTETYLNYCIDVCHYRECTVSDCCKRNLQRFLYPPGTNKRICRSKLKLVTIQEMRLPRLTISRPIFSNFYVSVLSADSSVTTYF